MVNSVLRAMQASDHFGIVVVVVIVVVVMVVVVVTISRAFVVGGGWLLLNRLMKHQGRGQGQQGPLLAVSMIHSMY